MEEFDNDGILYDLTKGVSVFVAASCENRIKAITAYKIKCYQKIIIQNKTTEI